MQIIMKKLLGFINRKGEWVIEPKFKKVKAFVNGLAPASTNGKLWGYINTKGEMVIPEKFRDAEIFSKNGLAPVKVNKLWGFINKAGELVIKDKYRIIGFNPFAMFSATETKGFIDGYARVSLDKIMDILFPVKKLRSIWLLPICVKKVLLMI